MATPRASKCVPWCGASSLYCTANSKMKVYCDFYSEDVWVQIIHALLSVFLFLWEFGMAWWSDGVRRERLVCCHCVIGTQLALTVYSVRAFHQKGTWHHYGSGAMTQPAKNVLFGSGVMRNLQHSVVMQRHNPQNDVFHPVDSLSLSDVSFALVCVKFVTGLSRLRGDSVCLGFCWQLDAT